MVIINTIPHYSSYRTYEKIRVREYHLNEGQLHIPLSVMGCVTVVLALLKLNGHSFEALAWRDGADWASTRWPSPNDDGWRAAHLIVSFLWRISRQHHLMMMVFVLWSRTEVKQTNSLHLEVFRTCSSGKTFNFKFVFIDKKLEQSQPYSTFRWSFLGAI